MNDTTAWQKNSQGWIRAAQRVFMVIALVAIVVYGFANRETVAATMDRLQLSAVLRTGAIMLVLHLLIVSSFHCLHMALGISRPWRRGADSYFQRLPGRFLPGGIWHSVMRYGDMHRERTTSARALGIVFLGESALLAGSGFIAAGAFGLTQFDHSSRAAVIAQIMLATGLMTSTILGILCLWRYGARTWKPLVTSLALMAITWTGTAFAFASLSAFGTQPMLAQCDAGAVAASYLGAASTGYVAVFAPQGWGVTELVFAAMRPCAAPVASLVTAVFAFRLVSLAADAFAFAVAMALRIAGNQNSREN